MYSFLMQAIIFLLAGSDKFGGDTADTFVVVTTGSKSRKPSLRMLRLPNYS